MAKNAAYHAVDVLSVYTSGDKISFVGLRPKADSWELTICGTRDAVVYLAKNKATIERRLEADGEL